MNLPSAEIIGKAQQVGDIVKNFSMGELGLGFLGSTVWLGIAFVISEVVADEHKQTIRDLLGVYGAFAATIFSVALGEFDIGIGIAVPLVVVGLLGLNQTDNAGKIN